MAVAAARFRDVAIRVWPVSRAAASAVMFETVPPLVNAPAAAGNPTNSATQRTA